MSEDTIRACFDIQRVACESYHFIPATKGEDKKKVPLEPYELAIKGLSMWLWKFLTLADR